MYRKENPYQMKFQDFYLPFGGKLNGENRWIALAEIVPWEHIERFYSENFDENLGSPAKESRLAFGALLLKERLGLADRELVEHIRENPYLQYFLGYREFSDKMPFHHSMMTHFRLRFSEEVLNEINEMIVAGALAKTSEDAADDNGIDGGVSDCRAADDITTRDEKDKPENNGKLIVDATCTPADITYPTDLNLLNKAREKTEAMIDAMHEPLIGKTSKPRTYRQVARKKYLAVAKRKRAGYKKVRKAIGQQLGFLSRNLLSIEVMITQGQLGYLDNRLYRELLVINELYRQQLWMYKNRSHKISGRITSISQPHVRPIIRGKVKTNVEFGAKISVSLVNGFGYVDRINWENYNESGDLQMQIESYRRRFGYYPESVHADQIYRTAANRKFCKKKGIRLSGPALGRKKKITDANKDELERLRQLAYQDEIDRIAIEGKFGQGKRRFSLGHVMTKLAKTSVTSISISFIVMNLERWLSILLRLLLCALGLAHHNLFIPEPGTPERNWNVQIAG